jgi:hypothetical protein
VIRFSRKIMEWNINCKCHVSACNVRAILRSGGLSFESENEPNK